MHEQQPASEHGTETIQLSNDVRNAALRQRIDESPKVGDSPHVWVGTVDGYLAAQPWGRWVSAAQPLAQVERDVDDMVRRAPVRADALPAWHAFSHSGFGRHQPDANASLREFVRRADRVREDVRAYTAWASLGSNERDWLLQFRRAYQGRFDRLQDWLVLQIESAGYDHVLDLVVPEAIRPHVEINLDSLAHEMLASGSVTTVKDPEQSGEFVFRLR